MANSGLSATQIARIIGVVFVVAGIAGYIPNPLVGEDGLFVTNTAHNVVHLATAVLFFVVAVFGDRAAARWMQIFGVVYLLVGVVGLFALGGSTETMLLGLVHINQPDNFLHLGLGAGIAAAGFYAAKARPVAV